MPKTYAPDVLVISDSVAAVVLVWLASAIAIALASIRLGLWRPAMWTEAYLDNALEPWQRRYSPRT